MTAAASCRRADRRDGLEAAHQGLFALDKVDLFNLRCIPPPARLDWS